MTDAGGGAVNLSYSNGGGVQSTAMLCLVASGDLPPGPFLFANVGADSEHPDTLAYIANHARPFAAAHGIEMVELHKARKGERDTVRQALERGIYHQLVPFDQVWAAAHDQAQQCAQSSPAAIQLTKRMLNETIGEHLGTLLSAGAAVSATAHTTEAAEEGLAAFLEKRDPKWW